MPCDSGIPDYRGPNGLWRRDPEAEKLVTYEYYMGDPEIRRRSWLMRRESRALEAQPNAAHRAVAELERSGVPVRVITQNVDGLHQAAGAVSVTELHGSLHRVVCLSCWARSSREELDARLCLANPLWTAAAAGQEPAVNPDGDVALEETSGFTVADCLSCGGLLKPDVVFFGENVPKPRVESCFSLVAASSALVVLGSSLTVMSGLRYVRRASSLGIPVVIVNQGTTRGDPLATARLDAPLGAALTALVRELGLADSDNDGSLSLV